MRQENGVVSSVVVELQKSLEPALNVSHKIILAGSCPTEMQKSPSEERKCSAQRYDPFFS